MRVPARVKPGPVLRAAPFLLLAAAVLIHGCAGRERRVPPPFYGSPLMQVRLLDASSVRGRRIVLDPGHGGTFSGAMGRAGLEEDDVNLGVALYLWGLLRDAGAEVFLTRSSDVDFLEGPDGQLRDDLAKRMEIASAAKPELFVSLHHNADISRSTSKNQIETYFKMLDDGPSRDAALLIHRHLASNLSIADGDVLAGNYFVLRNAPCPAVLGEPSYLSNPWVEEKLKLAQKQLLEAQAYFAGIVEYFDRGTPRIVSVSPCDTVVHEARPALSAAVSIDGTSIDPGTVRCRLDGRPLPADVDADNGSLKAVPDRVLASGTHEVCFSFRNSEGNSSGEGCARFAVYLPAAFLSLDASPGGMPEEGGLLVVARPTDANGNAVAEGTPVFFSSTSGRFSSDSVEITSGAASTVFFPQLSALEARLDVSCQDVSDSLSLRRLSARTHAFRITAANNGEPLEAVEIWHCDTTLSRSSPQGLAVLPAGDENRAILRKDGFVPFSLALALSPPSSLLTAVQNVEMTPVALGLARHRRIAIDVGGTPPYKNTEGGESAVEIGARLARMLRGAGAEVVLLGETLSNLEKVRGAEVSSVDRYLRLEICPEKRPFLLHYPGSEAGMKLAQACSGWWDEVVAGEKPVLREDAHYVLRHTSCPALVVKVPEMSARAKEELEAKVAYALYLAVLQDLGLSRQALSRLDVKAEQLLRDESVSVRLDEFLTLPLSGRDTVSFFCAEAVHSVRLVSEEREGALEFVALEKGERKRFEMRFD
ncbi:MAG: N-acetylmuramoyl-L-alanine amidase [Candidatus Eiseniibacteriota bacterium]|nr:MAG: N-acetylmuramoyl-L-alanine amidase [Candidatus Eisenbacteria bacterium]